MVHVVMWFKLFTLLRVDHMVHVVLIVQMVFEVNLVQMTQIFHMVRVVHIIQKVRINHVTYFFPNDLRSSHDSDSLRRLFYSGASCSLHGSNNSWKVCFHCLNLYTLCFRGIPTKHYALNSMATPLNV